MSVATEAVVSSSSSQGNARRSCLTGSMVRVLRVGRAVWGCVSSGVGAGAGAGSAGYEAEVDRGGEGCGGGVSGVGGAASAAAGAGAVPVSRDL